MKSINRKRNIRKYKILAIVLKSLDKFVNFATTSSSITLSLTGICLIVIPILAGIACGLTISNKILYEIIMQKYNKYKKQDKKFQQTIKFFDK